MAKEINQIKRAAKLIQRSHLMNLLQKLLWKTHEDQRTPISCSFNVTEVTSIMSLIRNAPWLLLVSATSWVNARSLKHTPVKKSCWALISTLYFLCGFFNSVTLNTATCTPREVSSFSFRMVFSRRASGVSFLAALAASCALQDRTEKAHHYWYG